MSRDITTDVVDKVVNNECYFQKYVIDLCVERLRKGAKDLIPGDNFPKGISLMDADGIKYYAGIEKIHIERNNDEDAFSRTDLPLIIGFKTSYKNWIVFFEIAYITISNRQDTRVFYKAKKNKTVSDTNIVLFSLNDCSLYVDENSHLAKRLTPILNYYDYSLDELNKKSDVEEVVINVNLYRKYYLDFNSLIANENFIILPVIGKSTEIKSITVVNELENGKTTRKDFNEIKITPVSLEDAKAYIEKFKEKEIILPRGMKFIQVDLIDLKENDNLEFRKLLIDAKYSASKFVYNIEGDRVRIKRIQQGIFNALEGKVVNKNLVDIICLNDISSLHTKSKKFNKDESASYLEILKTKYGTNKEQTEAIAKIMSMRENNIDVMLVQGPPGTGKTELILALAKELSELGLNTLISSNVHVACNNIVKRFINNKEMALKRYSAIQGELYAEELLVNKNNYIKNQVLEGFKHKNVVIDSRESFEKVKLSLQEAYDKKEKIIETNRKYDVKFLEYKKLINELNLLENDLEKVNEQALILQDDSSGYESEANELNKDINVQEQSLKLLELDRNKLETEYNSMYTEYEKISSEINGLFSKIEKQKNDVKNKQEEINTLAIEIEKSKIEKERKTNYKGFLECISEEIIQKEISNYFFKGIPYSNTWFKVLVDEKLRSIDDLVTIYNKLSEDNNYWNSNANMSISTIEYLYFWNKKKKMLPDFLEAKVTDLLSDVYEYNKCSSLKKVLMILPFIKLNGRNQKYYLDSIKLLNEEFKKIQFYNEEYIGHYVKKNVGNGEVIELKLKCDEEIKNIENTIVQKNSKISEIENEIVELTDDNNLTNTVISNKTKHVLNLCKQIAGKKESLSNKQTEVNCKHDELNILKEKYDKLQGKIAHSQSEIENNSKQRVILVEKITNAQDLIDLEYEKNPSEIDEYKKFTRGMINDLKILSKDIESFEIVLKRFNEKVSELKLNGWSEDEALDFLFGYVTEIEKIAACEGEQINHYIQGQGYEFEHMFELSDTSNGSLVSMTTNQVASLLYNIDKDLTFDYAIIDEASKCRFEDLIISLPRIKHLVLIGDFMQLDPMFKEYKKIDEKYRKIFNYEEWNSFNKSSFSQLLTQLVEFNFAEGKADFDDNPLVAVMKRQYRMNEGIYSIIEPIYSIHSGFELIDEKKSTTNDVLCVNVEGKEDEVGTSQTNIEEAQAIISFLNEFHNNREKYPNIETIGVITGYKAQENYIYRNLKAEIAGFELGTFDRFQGREYDLVIVSLVRSKELGFTEDIRRMNVAFSRAKNHLIIFGNIDALRKIAPKVIKTEDYDNISMEEKTYVVKKLIPQLYRLKNDFISEEERTKTIMNFLRENEYE